MLPKKAPKSHDFGYGQTTSQSSLFCRYSPIMHDPRLNRLAEILIDHSCQLKASEKILIEAIDLPDPALVCLLVELAADRGAHPLVTWKNNTVLRSLYRAGSKTNLGLAGDFEKARME